MGPMEIPIFAVILLVGSCVATVLGQGKHGFADYASQQSFGQQSQPVALGYTKVQQQQLAAAQKTANQPQLQYYTQPSAVKYINAPIQQQQQQQYQYEPQQFAYTQPGKIAAAAAPVAQKVPQYSLANDVSSFAYSSPIVSYNSLGLLTQLAGKAAAGSIGGPKSAYSSSAPVAPAPAAYQVPAQKVAYTAAPAKIPQYFTSSSSSSAAAAAGPQQYQQQPQQQYVSAAQYSPPQAYTISQPSGHYSQNQDDSQYTQGQAYAQTSAQPQYFSVPQLKYANSGASYSQ